MYTQEGLDKEVVKLKKLIRQYEDLSIQIENIKTKIKSHMTEQQVTELIGENWKINYNTISSNKFDQSEFKNDHPKLFDKYVRMSESCRLTIR